MRAKARTPYLYIHPMFGLFTAAMCGASFTSAVGASQEGSNSHGHRLFALCVMPDCWLVAAVAVEDRVAVRQCGDQD